MKIVTDYYGSLRGFATVATLIFLVLVLGAPVALAQHHGGGTTTVTTSQGGAAQEAGTVSASLKWASSMGIGAFVDGPQERTHVTSGITPVVGYRLSDEIVLSSAMSITWYQIPGYGSAQATNRLLLSDLDVGVSHTNIYKDEDLGLTLSGGLRAALPTSLAAQLQNRLFSLRPGLSLTWTGGPVSVSLNGQFLKYFMTSTHPSIDCEGFDDPSLCGEGRGPGPSGAFTSEKDGGELYLPGHGVNSFYVAYGGVASWALTDALSVRTHLTMIHVYGVVAYDRDEFTGEHAEAGRPQTDRLISSLYVAYGFSPKLSAEISMVTDTLRPLGATGKGAPVLFDVSRAPDNITSLGLSVTGSL